MMAQHRQFSDTGRSDIKDGIERVFAFVQDVLDDPAVLDDLPEKAAIMLTPCPDKNPSQTYATGTRRFAVSVYPSCPAHHRTHTA